MARDPVLVHAANARRTGRKYGIAPSVILGLLSQEGGTDPRGRPVRPGDGAGAPSFGQFTFGTAKALGVTLGNSASEVDGVGRYLIQLGYKNNPTRAIAAYNGGPGNPQYSYAAKVLSRAKKYHGLDDPHAPLPISAVAGSSTGGPAPAGAASAGTAGGALITDGMKHTAVKALLTIAAVGVGAVFAVYGAARTAGVKHPARDLALAVPK